MTCASDTFFINFNMHPYNTDYFRYYAILLRRNYVTPTSYLELIKTFKSLLGQKRFQILTLKTRYLKGLEKLDFASSQVSGRSLYSLLSYGHVARRFSSLPRLFSLAKQVSTTHEFVKGYVRIRVYLHCPPPTPLRFFPSRFYQCRGRLVTR